MKATHHNLILRSAKRVSKDGNGHLVCFPSFETLAALVPQDEVVVRLARETARFS
jgi:hypothetical protein